jgi:hypothetical protein
MSDQSGTQCFFCQKKIVELRLLPGQECKLFDNVRNSWKLGDTGCEIANAGTMVEKNRFVLEFPDQPANPCFLLA